MALAAAQERGLSEERILPSIDDWEVVPRVAVATAMQAQKQGVARLSKPADQLRHDATATIQLAREMARVLQSEEIIRPVPEVASIGLP